MSSSAFEQVAADGQPGSMPEISEPAANGVKPKKSKQQDKPRWLMILLFILSALYLLPEAIFNARLVQVAGGGSMDSNELHLVELFGRTISGIGVSLLLADWLLKGWLVRTVPRVIMGFVVITALAWPTVFFGQKLLIDKLLVDPSTSQQRQEAFFASILRSGLATNAVNISGLPYDPEHATKPEEMTFLALMGGLVYANSEFLGHVDQQKHAIVERYITNRAGTDFDNYYARYKGMRERLIGGWEEYQSGVKRYNAAIASSPARADKAWEQVESEVATGWNKYQKAQQAYWGRAEVRAQEMAPKIARLFDERNDCIERYQTKRKNPERLNSCIRSIDKDHERLLDKYHLSYQPLDYWLIRKEGRIKGETTIGQSVMTLGLSALVAGLEHLTGDAGEQVIHWVYSRDVSDYTPKIMGLWQEKFEKETGYPMGIADLQTFRQHAVTARKVRARLAKEGIQLASTWQINQIGSFQNAVAKRVKQEADGKWNREMRKQGWQLTPNLSWGQFQRSETIQARIKREMGERYYVSPMLADWNNKEFYRFAIVPNIKRETEHWIGYLDASLSQFADGGPLAEEGKNALRSVLVPPISMGLSLLLVILTALKLPLKFWQLVRPGQVPNTLRDTAISMGLILAVVIVPLAMLESKFTAGESTAGYFFDQVEQQSSPVTAMALRWVVHTQPVVQPLGYGLDEVFGVTDWFSDNLEHSIGLLDASVMPVLAAGTGAKTQVSEVIDDKGMLRLIPLTVKSNAPGARIRIMNIKPKYKAGMQLPVSNYDIQVSAPGYQTERRWVQHNQHQDVHEFNLKSE
ncbi:hypothetical protein L2750_05695 [Shewanella submarina]|uniref:Uncharacterized protein n=1 Tax=Shewanella submarina TaxID=2016376 RepID=A0ABV7G9F2_9GAMM|nr:hypothetical protein [Shewanella submarina]MCL1036645.1 hypothetical protein [Shewanella submarina]